MDKLSRVHVFECFDELIDDKFFMDLLEDSCPDDDV